MAVTLLTYCLVLFEVNLLLREENSKVIVINAAGSTLIKDAHLFLEQIERICLIFLFFLSLFKVMLPASRCLVCHHVCSQRRL